MFIDPILLLKASDMPEENGVSRHQSLIMKRSDLFIPKTHFQLTSSLEAHFYIIF